jgi:predicted N-acetyltransferase YhbS
LIKELRYNPTFIPNLSLVLKLENNIIGYALFTPIVVKGDHHSNVSLALAILTVLPKYRKLGFASQLVKKGIKKAQQLGFKSIATLGSLNYFQKFTFRPSDDFDIYYTHENQNHRCLLLELAPNGLEGVHGQIIFPTQSNYSLTSNE